MYKYESAYIFLYDQSLDILNIELHKIDTEKNRIIYVWKLIFEDITTKTITERRHVFFRLQLHYENKSI